DYEAAGKIREYDTLKIAVATSGEIDTAQAAATLGISPGTVRVLIHRLRKNFRAAFRDEIAETVGSRSEVDDEFRELLNVFL
ncbi:MAG: sigma-70 family RNA polymerase sigma factor, partial [bacterium]|nr:sigma-70 family RNA polymerase sigma factor [bacterium]